MPANESFKKASAITLLFLLIGISIISSISAGNYRSHSKADFPRQIVEGVLSEQKLLAWNEPIETDELAKKGSVFYCKEKGIEAEIIEFYYNEFNEDTWHHRYAIICSEKYWVADRTSYAGEKIFGSFEFGFEPETTIFSPTEVIERKEELAGKMITVRGVADIGSLVACTEKECPPHDPFCNSCAFTLEIFESVHTESKGIVAREKYYGRETACSGNERSITCWPLERGKSYIVTGIWNKENDSHYLRIIGFSP